MSESAATLRGLHPAPTQPEQSSLPKHIAFIMDGNGRWARQHGKPVQEGHKAGLKALERVLKAIDSYGISYITLYAFSTENWHRPKDEVAFLMDLLEDTMQYWKEHLKDHNYRLRVLGRIKELPDGVRDGVSSLVMESQDNTGMTVTLGLNYGSRDEILRAAQLLAIDAQTSKRNITSYTTEDFTSFLDTKDLPDLDLLVRSGGDQRISNFLLWQAAYSEMIFVDEYWPDFAGKIVQRILTDFQQRQRRFGGR